MPNTCMYVCISVEGFSKRYKGARKSRLAFRESRASVLYLCKLSVSFSLSAFFFALKVACNLYWCTVCPSSIETFNVHIRL